MKKILYSLFVCFGLIALASCEKTTQDTSKITYYVTFELIDGPTNFVPVGSTFKDPGVIATENGVDVKEKVKVLITDASGEEVPSVSTASAGMYTITYSALNADNFPASASRTVFVYDPAVTVSMAGTYSADMEASTYGLKGATFADYAASYGNTDKCTGIVFTELAPGIYQCNDLLAGWYNQIRGYGASYSMGGYVILNSDNSIDLLYSYIKPWGDGLDYIDEGVYDPEKCVITYFLSYAGQIFMRPVLVK